MPSFHCLLEYMEAQNVMLLSLVKNQQMLKEVVNFFINTFQILPLHVSAYGCHPNGIVSAL
jgi:hypothetical protein